MRAPAIPQNQLSPHQVATGLLDIPIASPIPRQLQLHLPEAQNMAQQTPLPLTGPAENSRNDIVAFPSSEMPLAVEVDFCVPTPSTMGAVQVGSGNAAPSASQSNDN